MRDKIKLMKGRKYLWDKEQKEWVDITMNLKLKKLLRWSVRLDE